MKEFEHYVDAIKSVFSTVFALLIGIVMICKGEAVPGTVFIIIAIIMTPITYLIVTEDYDREEQEDKNER